MDWIDGGKADSVVSFGMDDNPTLSESVKDRYRARFAGVFAQRMIEGKWVAAEGAIYPEYSDERLDGEEWQVLRTWVGVDYGTASATVFVSLCRVRHVETGEIKHVVNAEKLLKPVEGIAYTDKEIAEALIEFCALMSTQIVVIDPSAASLKAELRGSPFIVRNARSGVIDGIRTVQSLLKNRDLVIDPSCEYTLEEMQGYRWGDNERPVKEHDHAMDALRYVTMHATGRRSDVRPMNDWDY